MSGQLRRDIGTAKGRIKEYLNQIQELDVPEINPELSDIINITNLQKIKLEHEHYIKRLRTEITRITEKESAWMALIERATIDNALKEDALYEAKLEEEDNFAKWQEEARKTLEVLEQQCKKIEGMIRQVQGDEEEQSEESVTNTEQFDEMVERINKLESLVKKRAADTDEERPRSEANFKGEGAKVRMPEVKIPVFYGDPEDWPDFWANFKSSVHDKKISATDKFNYLKGALKGKAYQLIKNMPSDEANYKEAIEIFLNKYKDNEGVIESLHRQLRNLPPAIDTIESLSDTKEKIEVMLRQLRVMGDDINQSCFISNIKEKFPKRIIKDVEKEKVREERWTMESFRKALNSVLWLEEHACRTSKEGVENERKSAAKGKDTKVHNPTKSKIPIRSSAEAFSALTTETRGRERSDGQKAPYPCAFCGDAHFNSQCGKHDTIDARRERAKELELCYRCLRTGHPASQCRSNNRLCSYCSRNHNRAFCPLETKRSNNTTADRGTREESKRKIPEADSHGKPTKAFGIVEELHVKDENARKATLESHESPFPMSKQLEVTLLTAKAPVCNPEDSTQKDPETINLFFDSGSQRSYITLSLAKRLGLKKLKDEEILVYTFGAKTPKPMKVRVVQIEVVLKDGTKKSLQVSTVPLITNKLLQRALKKEDVEFIKKYMPGEVNESFPQRQEIIVPDMLVGADYFWSFLEEKPIKKCPSGIHMIPTKVGLLICGGQASEPDTVASYGTIIMMKATDKLKGVGHDPYEAPLTNAKIEEMWNLDTIGIRDSPESNDDEIALQQFAKGIKFENGRYSTGWPFKSEAPMLPDNYGLCQGRLRSLVKRLQDNEDLLKRYDEIIKDQLQKGIIEQVDGGMETGPLQHYLPHHPVITPLKSTTKLRIVYDASAKMNKTSKSLNECLYRGPIMMPDLCGLLLRFRRNRVAVTADVEKAFLQIGLHPPDRDVTRFLWLKDVKKPLSISNTQIYRFCRVTFGVISSPFLLNSTISHHLNQIGTENALKLAESLYVDNILTGTETVKEAHHLYKEAKEIFTQASMNLREWGSNSKEFIKLIDDGDQMKDTKTKILGIQWDTKDDTLQLSLSTNDQGTTLATKREVLQTVASTFDPLGLLAPVILKGKLLFQQLCEEKYDWDDKLSEKLNLTWNEIKEDWRKNTTFTLPRRIHPDGEKVRYQLSTFVDASTQAYATAVYLRAESEMATTVHLIFSKNRLAPKKTKITLPRLELMGMVIGVRATNFVAQQLKLPLEKKTIWSDSECMLHWIASSKPLATFVGNRVKEIREAEDLHFRYVPTEENPADLSTRGVKATNFKEERLWWEGPEWLAKSTHWWPEGNVPELQPEVLKEIEKEVKGEKSFHEAMLVNVNEMEKFTPLINANKISSWPKLLNITVYCLRFLKQKIWDKVSSERKEKIALFKEIQDKGWITVKEVRIATSLTLRQVQKKHFVEIHQTIKKKSKNQMIDQLGIQMGDDGLLRCHGRMANAELPEEARHPILLPRKEATTNLIILNIHQLALHNGVQHTLSQVRMNYWIPKGRSEVQKVIRSCIPCRRYIAKPYRLPEMPPLPQERVSQSRPFQHTGLDYLGPLIVKVAEDRRKGWICLFTCMATRAIHLELALDLSAEQFLHCVRRFVARRGRPDKIISDNAPSFKLVQITLQAAWERIAKDETTHHYFAHREIEWQFITEYAPWQGGFYERLVGSVKKSLRKIIGRKIITVEDLYTLLSEVEAVLNARPLTYIYNDFESRQVLRPVDFLIPNGKTGIPPLEEDHNNDEYLPPRINSKEKLLQMWKRGLKNLDQFWELWYNEYLLSLREKMQLRHKSPRIQASKTPQVNEVVIIKEEGVPRGVWRMGKITEVTKGRDGEIRSAKILLPNKTTIKRPINLLYPLEINDKDEERSTDVNDTETEKTPEEKTKERETETGKPRRSPRLAAKTQASSAFYILSLIALMISTLLTGARGAKCPAEQKLTRVQSQKCVREGIVILRTEEGNLCWNRKTCATGQLQGNGQCGPACPCPKWASECSYYEGPLPTDDGKGQTVLDLAQPSVCSFEPDPRCNDKPTHVQLNRIQLYDDTLHYVKALELRRAQLVTEEFECVGEGPQVGTTAFCAKHNCASSGTKFCYHRHNEVVYFTNENGEVPIKAWGQVPAAIYGSKEVPPENPSCLGCGMKCVKGGVEILLEEKIGTVEICSKPYCYKVSHPKQLETVLFPKDISIKPYEVTMKVWSNGYMIREFGIACHPSPYCEMIECYFCWNMLGNPQCAPRWALTVVFIMLYFGSMTLLVLIKLIKYSCQCLFYGSYFSWKCLRLCRIMCRRARSKTYENMYLPVYAMFQKEAEEEENEENYELNNIARTSAERRTKHQPLKYKAFMKKNILSIITILLIFNTSDLADACSEITTMTAQQSMCTVLNGGAMECVLTESTRLALVPQGQDSCLMIRDPNGQPIGTMAVEVEKITLECMSVNEYFTRSFEMKVASSKRCYRAGSCGYNQCGDVTIESKIEELNGEPNDSPGFTYCAESCGCAGCDCFYCVSGCLFYRTYAKPVSDVTYEVFSCPVWQYKVKATVRLTLPGENLQQEFDLRPGTLVSWKNLRMTLTSITSPPVPILGSQFLTDGTKTVLIRASAGGQPIAGMVGEFQCPTREKASKFDCYLPHDSCTCQAHEKRAACTCSQQKLEELFSKIEHVVPLTTQGLSLIGTGKNIEAEYNQIASLELQIAMEGFRLATKTDKNKCTIKPSDFAGCYSCLTGAKLKYECRTDFGEALAHVTCGEAGFSTVCTPDGLTATVAMSFQHAAVKEACTVTCPAGATTFEIEANLVFIEKERLGEISNAISTTNEKNDVDLGFLSGWLSGNWTMIITIVLGLIVMVILSVALLPVIIQGCLGGATSLTNGIMMGLFRKVGKQKETIRRRQKTIKDV